MKQLYYYDAKIDDDVMLEIEEDYGELNRDEIRSVLDKIRHGEEIKLEDYPESSRSEISDMLLYVKDRPMGGGPILDANEPESPENLISQAIVAPLGESFLLSESGEVEINRDHPPSLQDAQESFLQFYNLASLAEYAKDKSTWLLGSFINACQEEFGESFDPSQWIDNSERAYNTIYTASKVAEAFPPNKRKRLSYTHHKEAFFANIEDKQKDLVLGKAEDLSLTCSDTRTLAKMVKEKGNGVLAKIETVQDLRDLKANETPKNVTYLYETKDDLWKTTKQEATEDPPNGMRVLDLTNMKALVAGTWVKIKEEK